MAGLNKLKYNKYTTHYLCRTVIACIGDAISKCRKIVIYPKGLKCPSLKALREQDTV